MFFIRGSYFDKKVNYRAGEGARCRYMYNMYLFQFLKMSVKKYLLNPEHLFQRLYITILALKDPKYTFYYIVLR